MTFISDIYYRCSGGNDVEVYMPITELFEGKKSVLEIFQESADDSEEKLPIPKDEASYKKYLK